MSFLVIILITFSFLALSEMSHNVLQVSAVDEP